MINYGLHMLNMIVEGKKNILSRTYYISTGFLLDTLLSLCFFLLALFSKWLLQTGVQYKYMETHATEGIKPLWHKAQHHYKLVSWRDSLN